VDIATGMILAAGAINFAAITGASWFLPFILGIFAGMFLKGKFF